MKDRDYPVELRRVGAEEIRQISATVLETENRSEISR
jgi:hypothetical protein